MAPTAARTGVLLATLVAMAAAVGASTFIVERASVRILVDGEHDAEYEAALGDFGFPLYGRVLSGQILFNEIDNESNKACSPIDGAYVSNDVNAGGSLDETTVPVALIQRGDCYFAEKAFHAQEAQAQAVIIMDNTDENIITMSRPQVNDEEVHEIVGQVEIPTVLITKAAGEHILAKLAEGKTVTVDFDFREAITNPDNHVEWEFWGTSSQRCGVGCDSILRLHQTLAPMAAHLERLQFVTVTPYFFFESQCFEPSVRSPRPDSERCSEMCIRGDRYCINRSQLSEDPSVNDEVDQRLPSFHGRDIAYENLRQLCMHEQFAKSGNGWLWLTYVNMYTEECSMDSGRFTRLEDSSCGDRVLKLALAKAYGMAVVDAYSKGDVNAEEVKFDYRAFRECSGAVQPPMWAGDDSWRYEDVSKPHPLLDDQLAQRMDREKTGRGKVKYMPTIIINTNQYRGRLASNDVFSAICAGFSEGSEPRDCLSMYLQENECREGTDTCWRKTVFDGSKTTALSACIDTFRDFECKCPAGWEGDGFQCTDVNECQRGIANCDHICHNTPGGYRCSCRAGFKLVGRKTCIYQNYCQLHKPRNGGCEQTCIPKSGRSVRCACNDGLELDQDLKSCKDVDECAMGIDGCEQTCVNTDPRQDELGRKYFCTCDRQGYVLNLTDSLFRSCVPMSLPAVAAGTGVPVNFGDSGNGGGGGRHQTLFIVIGTLMGAALAVFLVALMYRRRISREMMSEEVKAIMREYISLPEDDMPPGGGGGFSSGGGGGGSSKSVRFLDFPASPQDIRTSEKEKEKHIEAIEVTPTSILGSGLDYDEDEDDSPAGL